MNSQHSASNLRYRPDIDGLRALAVIPVALFHLDLGFSGGFVGVDIFFVISGYLITSIIIKDIAKDAFSMRQFWARRIRRILPAAVVMVTATIIGASIVLYPEQFEDFGKEVVAQTTLVSNIYFWQQDDYFAAPSEHLALLHTWSLSVEEQFYFFFPLLLFALHKRGETKTFKWVLAITILSFTWSCFSLTRYPSATFFLLPSRAWELLIGAAIALFQYRKTLSHTLNEILSWLGIALIVYSIFAYDKGTPFPGAAAILPCIGAALLIFCNHQKLTFPGKILALPPCIFVGKISYSFYLWHWPLIVFAKYASVQGLSIETRVGIGIASLILAYLSWKFVETPFRKKTSPDPGIEAASQKRAFKGFYISCAVFILLGAVIYKTDGLESRFSKQVLTYLDRDTKRRFADADAVVETGKLPLASDNPANTRVMPILLWGDSHARCALYGIEDLCDEYGINFYMAPSSGTPPLVGITCPPKVEMTAFNDAVLNFIKTNQIREVILVARWSAYPLGDESAGLRARLHNPSAPDKTPKEVFKDSLPSTIAKIRQAGAHVWILKQVPKQDLYVPKALANAIRYGRSQSVDMETLGITIEQHLKRQSFVNGIIDANTSPQVIALDPLPYLSTPSGHCRIEKNGNSLYHDEDHVSRHGSREFKPLFEPIFKQWVETYAPATK